MAGRRARQSPPYRRSRAAERIVIAPSVPNGASVATWPATNLPDVRLFKTLFKLTLLAIVGAAIAAVTGLIKKTKASDVSVEQWPDVPRNPAA